MRNQWWALLVLVMAVLYGVLFIEYQIQSSDREVNTSSPSQPLPPVPTERVELISNDEENNVRIFQEVSPSTVFITTRTRQRNPFSLNVTEIPQGSGTGFMWDQQGHIVTNAHVVEGASSVLVTLFDQSNWDAEIVGLALDKDLAVLRIKAPASLLRPVVLGDSDRLLVGRKVLAIGNPFGLDYTLTTGIISALGREIQSPNRRRISGVIQTDAAINVGNSGGPLLDINGRLIGVNTSIVAPAGGSVGIGFAVPVNTVKMVIPDLIRYGRVRRPALGINILDDTMARRLGIVGVPIYQVQAGSGADQAGLQGVTRHMGGQLALGDIIVAINNQPIRDSSDLLNVLESHEAGDKVTVRLLRNGREMETMVVLGTDE